MNHISGGSFPDALNNTTGNICFWTFCSIYNILKLIESSCQLVIQVWRRKERQNPDLICILYFSTCHLPVCSVSHSLHLLDFVNHLMLHLICCSFCCMFFVTKLLLFVFKLLFPLFFPNIFMILFLTYWNSVKIELLEAWRPSYY